MNHYLKYFFCLFFATSSMLDCSSKSIMPKEFAENPVRAIALYYAANITPWHNAAREAVNNFNQLYPDQRLKVKECEKLSNLLFRSKNEEQDITLAIKQEQWLDAFRIKLNGPDLHKEHVSQNPETLQKALYNMLVNHLAKKTTKEAPENY